MSSSLITPNAPGLPTLSRTLTAFKDRIIRPEPTDQRYHNSFAERLSDLGGRCRWALAGSASIIWEGEDPKDGLRRRIDELVDEHEGEIHRGRSVRCDATTLHCWMMGSDKAYARPTVVISHNDQDILKRAMRVILRPKMLISKGFGLKGCPNCDLELYTVDSKATLLRQVDEAGQDLPISLCGAEIEVKNPVRSATLGGAIIIDGTFYGVTVAHAFTESRQASNDKLGNNVVLYDSDWAESSSGDESMGHGAAKSYESPTSSVSKVHEKTNCPAMACAIRSNRTLIRHDMGEFPVAVISSQNPLRDVDDDNYDDVDWALIEISNPSYHGMNGVFLDNGKRSWLAFSSFRDYPPRGSILTATRKGAVRGLGTGSTSSIKLLGSSRNRAVWSIQTERALVSGDSGAWVVDAATGDIYGVLVAGSAMIQEGFVIPARDIIDDIQRSTKARELRMPSMNDYLCLASRYGNVDLVKSLLAAGVVINDRPGFTESSSALLEATEHKQLEVMKVLLSTGARFDDQGGQQYGQKAVLAALRSNHTYLVKELISAGAQHWNSTAVPDRISTVEEQARTHNSSVRSIKRSKTEDFRLTAQACESLEKSGPSQIDSWSQTAESHELVALGRNSARSLQRILDFLERVELGIEENELDTKLSGLALQPTIISQ